MRIMRVQNGYIMYLPRDLATQCYEKGYVFSTLKQLAAFLLDNEDLLK